MASTDAARAENRFVPDPPENETPGSSNWLSEIEAAEVIDHTSDVPWDDEADFVIVGYGGAGIAAAVQAAELTLDVLAIDRFDGGGSTAMNGGVFYAGGTSVQREAGIDDSPEEMFKYLATEVQGVVKDETLRRFCEESPETIEWLKQHGVGFSSRAYLKKTSYPNPSYYLYHSDSSLNKERAKISKPAPRGHRVLSPPLDIPVGYGVYLTKPLSDSAARLGVRVRTQSEVRQLILDKTGRVVGVKTLEIPTGTTAWHQRRRLQARANRLQTLLPPTFPGAFLTYKAAEKVLGKVREIERKHRVPRRIRARTGVCLAAGGFVFNRTMIHHYAPNYDLGLPLGQPGDDGSGIRLGQTAGGVADLMERVSGWRGINPPDTWPKGMLVNAKGERFIDETLYMANLGHEICENHNGVAFIILDEQLNKQTWHSLFFGGLLGFQRNPALLTMLFRRRKAASLEALAKRCGFDPAILAATVKAYNQAADGVATDPFRKDPSDMHALRSGPYYAIDVSITNNLLPLSTMTIGGLRVNESTGEVTKPDGSPISGLYAAGRTAIGICSNIYVSGLSMADCVFSGRRAARHAAAKKQSQE